MDYSARWPGRLRQPALWLIMFPLAVTCVQRPALAAPAPTAGPPEILLSGRPAPRPSSAVCGFALTAHETGPQVATTERPPACVVSLEPGEEVEVAVPVQGLAGDLSASAEVIALEPGEAEITLSLNNETSSAPLPRNGVVHLRVSAKASGDRVVLRLKTSARSAAAVRWRNVRLARAGREIVVPLAPKGANDDDCPPRVLPALRRPIEQALIEWDWRMQDGIDTERVPASYADAIERTLKRGETLLKDLQASGVELPAHGARWQELRRQSSRLSASARWNDPQWEEFWRQVHLARRELVFSNPLLPRGPLAFIKQVPGIFSHQLTQYYGSCARPGGGVFVLESPGQSMACRPLAPGALPQGSYQHLDLSHAGDRLLFSYCRAPTTPKNREEHLDRFYHLYEMAADGSGLRQLTDGAFDDFAPRHLPDGRLLFVSTRRGGFHRCGRGPCAVYTLCVAGADGSSPRPISWHETHEWDPAVLHDGRVIYTRWDYVDRHAVYYEQLWTVRPDGSDVRIYYGNNTFNPVGVWEAQPVPGSRRIMATAGAHHAMTAGSIVLLDTAAELDGAGPITRLTPDALFPESEAPLVQKPNGFWIATAGLVTPPAVPAEAARWPGHCYRTPLPLSEKFFLAAYSFDPLIGEPTWNRANMFGLYAVDAFGNKELLYRDLNIASLWPRPLRPTARPDRLSGFDDAGLQGEGAFFLQNVRAGWPSLPPDTIRRLRIVQVLPKSTPHINSPPVGLPNASPGRQVLGTVPVEADGSAWFRAPAGLPLAFQALDDRGQAVLTMRSVTYLQPGETAACLGCHEPRTAAPPQAKPALALRRPPSSITPGPDGSKPFSYPRLVQPVLDRHCVRCHNAAKPDGKVVLTGESQGQYTVSYNALSPRVMYSAWGARGGDFREANSEPVSQPDFFGARGSKIMQQLLAGQHHVTLGADDIERLATWMDANALFYGTFDPADQARQLRRELIAGPQIQ